MTTYGSDVGKWFSSPCEYTGLEHVCEVPSTVDGKLFEFHNDFRIQLVETV